MTREPLTMAAEALTLIKEFESLRLAGYRDPIGIPTIGYGHTEAAGGLITYVDGQRTARVRVGARITADEAERLKAADLATFAKEIDPLFKVGLNPLQYGAAMSLAFNIGPGNFRKSSVLREINAGRLAKAADAFLLWDKAGGVVLPGLVRRRKAERALFLGDIAGAEKWTGERLRPTPSKSPTTPALAPLPPPPDIPKPETPASAPREGFWARFMRRFRGKA